MRKTNAEIAQLLYNRAEGYAAVRVSSSDKRMEATQALADKYTMKHVMASMRHLYPVVDWKKAFDEGICSETSRGVGVRQINAHLGSSTLHKRAWRMAEECFNHANDGRNQQKQPQGGLTGRAFSHALNQWRSLFRTIEMRPDYDWGLALCNEDDEYSHNLMAVEGQRAAKDDIILSLALPYTSDYGGETRFLKLPLSWGKQVEKLGVLTIDNKIVKRAKYIGMFGDVEGYQVTLYQRGVKPTQFKEVDVYIGKLGETIKICKSRMYIKSVTRRKVGADVGAELLGAFD